MLIFTLTRNQPIYVNHVIWKDSYEWIPLPNKEAKTYQ